jgi:hypothetical protein
MRRPQLPDLKLPAPRLPRPSFRPPTFERLQEMSGPLGFFFYLLMFVAVLAIFTGDTGAGVLALLAGAGLHVVRSSVEEVSAQRRARAERKREVRLRPHRAARARAAQPRPAPSAPPEIRITAAAPRARRRANVR